MESTSSTFQNLGLPPSLLKSLAKMNFQNPTPIQEQAIPIAMAGKDIIGRAQTGTGKTGAFVIPLVARLLDNPESMALILTPTRELALQIFEVAKQMVWFEKKFGTALLIGGSSYGPQFQQLRARPRMVIGTPGRVQDHVDQKSLRLEKTGFLVLDEADRMLDMGFAPQIESILKSVPKDRQTFLFTATLPREIERICGKFMRDPQKIEIGENSRPIEKIKQTVVETTDARKLDALFNEIQNRDGSMLIFAKTKRRTERLSKELYNAGFEVTSIHGDRSQRQRSDAILDFRKGVARILVATDVAARGLDVPHIAHVINFDLPQVPEDFVHRIGRTARAGAEGEALTFVTPSERGMWRRIQYLIGGPVRRERPQRPEFKARPTTAPVAAPKIDHAASTQAEAPRQPAPRFEARPERPRREFRDQPRRDYREEKQRRFDGGARPARGEDRRAGAAGSTGFRPFGSKPPRDEDNRRDDRGERPRRGGGPKKKPFNKFSSLRRNEDRS